MTPIEAIGFALVFGGAFALLAYVVNVIRKDRRHSRFPDPHSDPHGDVPHQGRR